jgi:hypothetical protein
VTEEIERDRERVSITSSLTPHRAAPRDFSRKLDRRGGGKLGFPKIEGGQRQLASGKVIQLNFGNCILQV